MTISENPIIHEIAVMFASSQDIDNVNSDEYIEAAAI
jgi:hypothetical protein